MNLVFFQRRIEMKRQMIKSAVGLVMVMGALMMTSGNAKADPDCLPTDVTDLDCQEAAAPGRVCEVQATIVPIQRVCVDTDGDCHRDSVYNKTEYPERCLTDEAKTQYYNCTSTYFEYVTDCADI
jgi:hypothetical protein